MKLPWSVILISYITHIACERPPPALAAPPNASDEDVPGDNISRHVYEDQKVINETISRYGSPQNFKELGLPGAELAADENRLLLDNSFNHSKPGVYTLRIRTITEHFSYSGRYEERHLKTIDNQEIPIIKGQFGEHFERKSGGYYVRTIGYTLNENGYRQFLIDLSTARTLKTGEVPYSASGPPTAFSGNKVPVSQLNAAENIWSGPPGALNRAGNKVSIWSTVLTTLIGGNSIG